MSNHKRPRLDDDGGPNTKPSEVTDASVPRKSRACSECKKHKIKCETQPGQTKCNKCLKSNVPCTPHNFVQRFIGEDTIWKNQATSTIGQLKAAVEYLLQQSNLPELAKFDVVVPAIPAPLPPIVHQSNGASLANFTSEGPSAVEDEDDSDLVPVPMNNLYNLTEPRNSRLIRVDPTDVNGPDFISQGIITLDEAEYLFGHYRDRINPLLWEGILCPHRTLQDARQSSTLLVATVLTVAALHSPDREHSLNATYNAFVSLMRNSCLLRSQNLDDVRGFCIGAFYLTSLSWALMSRAVRVATEMNLHKISLQFSHASPDTYDRVRLWYAIYVCDHQFALAYGRPPMMHEDAAVRNVDKFLASDLCTQGDIRLVEQVSLFRILADAYFMYGCDPDLELGEKDFQKLHSFNVAVDQWRLMYSSKTAGLPVNGMWPSKGTLLFYHLARFQLNSLSLRGISARNASDEASYANLSWDRREAANIAISAATSTLKLIIEQPELSKALISMPIFTHAMVSVCASFVLKMAVAFGGSSPAKLTLDNCGMNVPRDLFKFGLNFHTEDALSNIQDLTRVLSSVADKASNRHVLRHIVTGLKDLLKRFIRSNDGHTLVYTRTNSILPHLRTEDTLAVVTQDILPARTMRDNNDTQVTHQSYHHDEDFVTNTDGRDYTFFTQSDHEQDPFDLMGDLDWRFNDSHFWTTEGGELYY